ncbi:MAG: transketolase, partial [Alphaproteobacteria bacterium]
PYGGGFLIFSDYCRPSIRLASLMGIRVVHVLTHDSIGLGEDGPTHQPVEQLAALRAIPGLVMFRPADATETAEAWQLALETKSHPSGLALTRQNLIAARTTYSEENLTAKGAYVLSDAKDAKVSIFAAGSEVEIALKARELLAAKGVAVRVVSVPAVALFDQQSDAYKASVIGTTKVNIAVEAGIRQGWDHFIGRDGGFVGMKSFGASAPYKDLYKHFGITAEAVVDMATEMLA